MSGEFRRGKNCSVRNVRPIINDIKTTNKMIALKYYGGKNTDKKQSMFNNNY